MGAYTPGQAKEIPIGDFAPDLPMDTPGIILDAVGARPTIAGFRPLPNLSEFGDALPTKPLGSYLAYYSDETTKLFAATEAGLWRLNGTSWVDAGVFPSSLSHVQFTQFGDDVLCVGSGAVGNKRVLIAAAMGNTFSLIAWSPQNPTVIVAVGGQVLTFVGQTWFSSAAGDDTDWTADVATLAATGTLYDFPGPVIAASSVYRNALAFKKNGILLGQQSGPPFSWTWEPVSNLTGTWGQGCVVRGPSWVAFIGVDNFYMTTGYGPEPIPNNLASWFFRTVNRTTCQIRFLGTTPKIQRSIGILSQRMLLCRRPVICSCLTTCVREDGAWDICLFLRFPTLARRAWRSLYQWKQMQQCFLTGIINLIASLRALPVWAP